MRVSKADRRKNARQFYTYLISEYNGRAAIVIQSSYSKTNPNIQRTQFLAKIKDSRLKPIVIAESVADGITGCFSELIELIGYDRKQEYLYYQNDFNEWLYKILNIRIVYDDGFVIMLERNNE